MAGGAIERERERERRPPPAGEPRAAAPREPRAIASAPALSAAALSAVAGTLHVKALVDHAPHWWFFGVFFGCVALAQLASAAWLYRGGRSDRVLLAAIYGNLAVVAIWLATRVVGSPVGPYAGEPEPIGATDLICSLDELFVVALLVVMARPDSAAGRRLGWLTSGWALRLAMALGSASLFAALLGGHSHSAA